MAPSSLRVAFLGNDPWSVPSLRAIAGSRHRVALVVTAPARPAGRGAKLRPTAVAVAAQELGLERCETARIGEGPCFERLRDTVPDVLVVVAYGELLPTEVLQLAPEGAINLHFSLLPELRGADPVRHTLLEGHRRTGVTTIAMDEGLDTGPVLERHEVRIEPDEDAGTLGARLAEIGAGVLVSTLDRLADGTLEPREQEHAGGSRADKLAVGERELDWSRPADELADRVRAMAPEPGAETWFRGRRLKVFSATAEPASTADPPPQPGTLLVAPDAGMLVATGDGILRLREVAPEGRRRMPGSDFLRGARPEPGERVG